MSYSGLSERERVEARRKLKRSAMLVYNNRSRIHYSQGPERWNGIIYNRRAYKGQYPTSTDCSAMNTWMLYDALKPQINEGLRDIVNGGKSWRDGGYTGTMISHGVSVGKVPKLVGDCVIYGSSRANTKHVALYIGNGNVLSHGSEGGPYIVAWNYRTDIVDVRRYL